MAYSEEIESMAERERGFEIDAEMAATMNDASTKSQGEVNRKLAAIFNTAVDAEQIAP